MIFLRLITKNRIIRVMAACIKTVKIFLRRFCMFSYLALFSSPYTRQTSTRFFVTLKLRVASFARGRSSSESE